LRHRSSATVRCFRAGKDVEEKVGKVRHHAWKIRIASGLTASLTPGSTRRRALKSALIVFKDGYCDIKCQILDFSDTSALLKPADVLQPR
jgi:hypothetical protein